MKNIERFTWIALLVLFAALYFQKQPTVSLAAPPKAAIQVMTKNDKPCTQITHRWNPQTGRLEPVAANDPLGIR